MDNANINQMSNVGDIGKYKFHHNSSLLMDKNVPPELGDDVMKHPLLALNEKHGFKPQQNT